MRWTIVAAAVACAAGGAAGPVDSAPRGPEGVWQGTISGVRLVLRLERDPAGRLAGTLDSPDQGAHGLPLGAIRSEGDSLWLSLAAPPASYRAAIGDDGAALTGTWSQGGAEAPLDFRRLDRAPERRRRPQDPEPPYPYRAEEVRYDNVRDGVTLAGTLTLPAAGGPFAAALLITGSGPENRDEEVFGHRPFLVLADHLTRRGIAVLRVDDRGVGGSTGSHETATSEDFAADVLAGVAFLKARKDVDPERIGLIGHSEGGMIASIAAARSRDVAWIALLAGTGVPGDSLLLMQTRALLRAAGRGDSTIDAQSAAMRRVLSLVRQGADSAAIHDASRPMVESQLAALGPLERAALGSPESLALAATRIYLLPWMRFFVTFDPREALARVEVPVLAICGGRDLQVPAAENLEAIRSALARGGNRDVTVKELPGLNHLFQDCSTCTLDEYARIEETFSPRALETISGWIVARAAPRPVAPDPGGGRGGRRAP